MLIVYWTLEPSAFMYYYCKKKLILLEINSYAQYHIVNMQMKKKHQTKTN